MKYAKIIWVFLFFVAISAPCDIIMGPRLKDIKLYNKYEPPFTLPEGVEISMKSAYVRIIFDKEATTGAIRAKVWCVFDMVCGLAPKGGTSFQMGFPVYEMKMPATIQLFEVKVDGRKVEHPEETTWKFLRKKDQWNARCRWYEWGWNSKVDPNQNHHGFFWPVTFKRGETKRIKVTYTLVLPVNNNCADFTYAVSSGALWTGTIGKELVRANAKDGLILNNDPSKKELEWEFVTVDPNRDISIHICAPSPEKHSRKK